MGLITHTCKNCGKEFENYFEKATYCSKDCYYEYCATHGKYGTHICESCGTEFKKLRENHCFCSAACRAKATEKKEQCICDNCGKSFMRIISEIKKNKRHYCSEECKRQDMYWSPLDTEILANNYHKVSYKKIAKMLSRPRSAKAVSRKAIDMGLTRPQQWSDEEVKILIENYSSQPMPEVIALLPHRTLSSIMGQAKKWRLTSYFNVVKTYTKEDYEYLRNNYLTLSNEEMAKHLNRTPLAIAQKLYLLDLHRPADPSGYRDLIDYVRSRLSGWKNKLKEDCNYTCAVTGCRSNIIVHHIRGFNLLFNETMESLDFPIYEHMSQYTIEQLDCFVNTFLNIQELYGEYICITEDVHKQFHSQYGCGDNTKEQWEEFLNKNYK